MMYEQLCRFKESLDWEDFCRELDILLEKEIAKYEMCLTETDFRVVRARISMIREVKRYPEVLKEMHDVQGTSS